MFTCIVFVTMVAVLGCRERRFVEDVALIAIVVDFERCCGVEG